MGGVFRFAPERRLSQPQRVEIGLSVGSLSVSGERISTLPPWRRFLNRPYRRFPNRRNTEVQRLNLGQRPAGWSRRAGTRLSRLGSLGHIASGLWNPGQCQAAPGAQLSFCAWKMSPLGRTNSGAEHGGGLASIPTRLRNYTWSGCRAVKPATRAKSLVFRVTKIA